ncbi:MAG: hypothetical protein ACREI3_01735 [Nitrospirales bacterium]
MTTRGATERDGGDTLRLQRAAFSAHLNLYEVSAWTMETLESLARDAKDKIRLLVEDEGACRARFVFGRWPGSA